MESVVKYGQEIGPNLIKIAKKLLSNEDLLMLLENTDLDPLNKDTHPAAPDPHQIFNKLIRVVPLITPEEQNTKSKLVLLFSDGEIKGNYDNENLTLLIHVYCPFKEWQITGNALRPFAIMSEIRKSLQDKRINGLGEISYRGFNVALLSEEVGTYEMEFKINAFS